MALKPGMRLGATSSTCEVMIIRVPRTTEVLSCAGTEMRAGAQPDDHVVSDATVLLGKRYTDQHSGVEVLCVKPGGGPLRIGDRELIQSAAKPLPASD
jgi:hypothetical protein